MRKTMRTKSKQRMRGLIKTNLPVAKFSRRRAGNAEKSKATKLRGNECGPTGGSGKTTATLGANQQHTLVFSEQLKDWEDQAKQYSP